MHDRSRTQPNHAAPNIGAQLTLEADDAEESTFASDVRWVFGRLDDPRSSRESAPSSGAWNMLLWARNSRSRFYEQVLPKALTAKAACEPTVEVDRDNRDEAERKADFGKYLKQICYEIRIGDATPQLLTDVESLVDRWSHQYGVELTAERRERLSQELAGDVAKCIKAAVLHPEAIGKFVCAPG